MLWKDFLEFTNIILEEKLSNRFKNTPENFSHVKLSCKALKLMVLDHPRQKFSRTCLNLLDNISSKMYL
jgi:hypothetical protein